MPREWLGRKQSARRSPPSRTRFCRRSLSCVVHSTMRNAMLKTDKGKTVKGIKIAKERRTKVNNRDRKGNRGKKGRSKDNKAGNRADSKRADSKQVVSAAALKRAVAATRTAGRTVAAHGTAVGIRNASATAT